MGKRGEGKSEKIRVIIVDDHPIVRTGLRIMLEACEDGTTPCRVLALSHFPCYLLASDTSLEMEVASDAGQGKTYSAYARA